MLGGRLSGTGEWWEGKVGGRGKREGRFWWLTIQAGGSGLEGGVGLLCLDDGQGRVVFMLDDGILP